MLKVTNQLQFLPTKTSLSAINCVSAQVRINDTCNAFFNLPISYYDSSPAMPSSICQSPTMIAATERAASIYIDISHA